MKAHVGDVMNMRVCVVEVQGPWGDIPEMYWVELVEEPTVRLRVHDDALEYPGDNCASVLMEDVVHIKPRKLAVGDRVNISCAGRTLLCGIILMIDGEEAWLKMGSGARATVALKELVRA